MSPADLPRYWRTIRHLRPKQVASRLWIHLRRPRIDAGPSGQVRSLARPFADIVERIPSMTTPHRFRFLNVEAECRAAIDWNHPARPKLWLYNLHYFDDLNAVESHARATWHEALIERWITENPLGVGNGWEPYPVSLRIANWIKWAWRGAQLSAAFERSLATQARWLEQRVEEHLLGNHLIANAKALTLAGMFFDGAEASRWLRRGVALLDRELGEQVLSDGAHSELSPMYHAIVLEDLLDVINGCVATGAVPITTVDGWRATASRMLFWLSAMTHPDGDIAFFNDSAFGVAPRPDALFAYAARLGIAMGGVERLSESGFVRLERGDAVLIADLASVGDRHQPGHAHADTLSFELSLFGERVLVNSGTSTYEAGPQRAFERSTAAHNALEVDGVDSSEVWSAFRVGRRATILDRVARETTAEARVAASHDGYRHRPGRPVHHREWCLNSTGLRVHDRIEGRVSSAVARFHVHPDVRVEGDRLILRNGAVVGWTARGGEARVVESNWYPEFGRRVVNQCIEIVVAGATVDFTLSWPEHVG